MTQAPSICAYSLFNMKISPLVLDNYLVSEHLIHTLAIRRMKKKGTVLFKDSSWKVNITFQFGHVVAPNYERNWEISLYSKQHLSC